MQYPIRHFNHTLEQKSETFVRNYLPQDWNVTRPNNDYGQDLNLEICEEGQYRGLDLIVQLKSSLSCDVLGEKERQNLKVSTYNYLMSNVRVAMLIKYVEEENEAYWILLKDISPPKKSEQESFTVHIPRNNKISNINWDEITNFVREVTDDKLKIRKLSDSLEKVRNELEETKIEFLNEKNIIKQLDAVLNVTFSGKWNTEPFAQILSPVSHKWLITLKSENGFPEIKLYASETYSFESLSNEQAKFNARLSIKAGDMPLGESISVLKNYKVINILIPFIQYNYITDSKITVNSLNLLMVFNGKEKKTFNLNENFDVEVKTYNNDLSTGWAIFGFYIKNENVFGDFN